MKAIEYFISLLSKREAFQLELYFSIMAYLPVNSPMNKYLKIEDNKYYANTGDTWVEITDVKPPELFLKPSDKFILPANTLENQPEEIETYLGLVIANKHLLASNFGSAIPYINERFDIDKIESMIAKLLQDEVIKVDQLVMFVDSAALLEGFSRLVSVSSTPKGMLPPPNIGKLKAELIAELTEKYGPSWAKNKTYVVEFEERLRAIDSEWLKDDPANGKLLSGKVKKEARTKQFLTVGADPGFDDKGLNVTLVTNSLLEGFPADTPELTVMFNSARAGSYFRGKETQKGGSAAKETLRVTSAFTITANDCGTTIGKLITVTKDIANSLYGRYYMENGVSIMIEKPETLIGKTITIRSPQMCKEPGTKFCAICAGKIMSERPNGISLNVADTAGIILNSSMKKVHVAAASSIVFDIREVMS